MQLNFETFGNKVTGQMLYLELFAESGIVSTSYIPVNYLEHSLRYNILDTSLMVLQNINGKFEDVTVDFTIRDLLKESPEVREYARIYFPEHYI